MNKVHPISKQFIKFGMVGVSNTLVSLAIYYCFIAIDPSTYVIGSIVGFLISVLNSYFWNNRYVFRTPARNHLKTLGKTYLAYGFTSAGSIALLVILVEVLGISEVIAPIINLMIMIPINFLLNKYWAFR